ncbi:MRG-domain-containing protein [Auriculariales sp. MPI-PUGE-AT-0066]|nr:MRG-domain-containing protein [Auriculariales sp. MPI-PUGE-AT-0066]
MAAQGPTSAPTYTVNERVLCFHGPLLYEAKVLKVENFDEGDTPTGVAGLNYRVHYKGWKQTWDETVPPNRLLKYTEANIARQEQLQRDHQAGNALPKAGKSAAAAKAGASAGASGAAAAGGVGRKDGAGPAGGGPRGHKRGRPEYEDKPTHENMKLQVPELLKAVLVDDWEAITKNEQLISLPRNPTVVKLLEEYKTWAESHPNAPENAAAMLPTIVAGLTFYFDKAIGSNLLYRFERPQYAEMKKQYKTGRHLQFSDETAMSGVYGAEHLLRMIVTMPTLIASSAMDRESVAMLRDYLNLLLVFMSEHKDKLFLTQYENTPTSYQNTSRA